MNGQKAQAEFYNLWKNISDSSFLDSSRPSSGPILFFPSIVPGPPGNRNSRMPVS
jgi:hypothetical protein